MRGQGQIIGSRTNPADDYHYVVDVNPEGAVSVSGVVSIRGFTGSIIIGSVSANVDLGSVYIIQDVPTAGNMNNPAWSLEYTGSVVTRVVQFIGLGSYVQDITYDIGSAVTNIGSYY